MIRRVLALCVLLSLLCISVISETIPYEEPVGLQIGKRFISGPVILKGGNDTIFIDEYTDIRFLAIDDYGVTMEQYPVITEVKILPNRIQFNDTAIFSVQLFINPSQPIKAVEVNISFNPSQLQVMNVTQGDLFDGFPMFFVIQDIDNDAGYLVAYGLIIGQGNTTDDGIFINILFDATTCGASSLTFNDLGITNETEYIDCLIEEATVYIAYSWDIVPDGVINYIDMSSCAGNYGQSGQPGWMRADVNDDGKIDYIDISAVLSNYGKIY